ncbi:multi-copper oxidase [Mycena belliarum]|uniref:Multi-copper oxidase n=1 Tax=Mycena belliarum TaxID=1033014 RepID=A0AAD6TKD5_9AGAR|nr:multi-copper oxidase [Mycena belliae]
MPRDAPWPDAALDVDENTLLMKTFDGDVASDDELQDLPPTGGTRRPFRWRTVPAACFAAVFLVLLIGVWLNSKDPPKDVSEFDLDPDFLVESTSRTRVYRWTVSQVVGAPIGVNKTMVVVNGASPGPLIEANHNDRIIVYVRNGLDREGTSIHWYELYLNVGKDPNLKGKPRHGLFQNHTDFYDGTTGVTQCAIPPGETLVYNFTLDGWAGTTWWHGHTDMQHTEGLFGAIVVHQPAERVPRYNEERVIVLSDIYNTPAAKLLPEYLNSNPMETVPEPVPDAATINGRGQFGGGGDGGGFYNFSLAPHKTYRLRLINAGSFAPLRFAVDGHVLTVVEADGTPVEPLAVDSLTLQVAQRYSVLLSTDQVAAAYWMRVTIDESMFAYTNEKMQKVALGVVRYTTAPTTALPPPLPLSTGAAAELIRRTELDETALIPAEHIDAPAAGLAIPFTFSIQRTHFQNWRSFMNGTSWELLSQGQATRVAGTARGAEVGTRVWPGDQLIASIHDVQSVDFVINNLDDAAHPFHLHGYKPWIMATGRGRFKPAATMSLNTTNPMRRDTFFVPARGWAVIRIVTDTPGYWAFHCHIAWHMAAGGLFQVAVQPATMAEVPLPADIVAQCESWLVSESTLDSPAEILR